MTRQLPPPRRRSGPDPILSQTEFESLARRFSVMALQTLVTVAADPSAPVAARVSASRAICDHGYGRPCARAPSDIESSLTGRINVGRGISAILEAAEQELRAQNMNNAAAGTCEQEPAPAEQPSTPQQPQQPPELLAPPLFKLQGPKP